VFQKQRTNKFRILPNNIWLVLCLGLIILLLFWILGFGGFVVVFLLVLSLWAMAKLF
jgi:hypothetical protein